MSEITINDLREMTCDFELRATAYGTEIKAISKGEK